MDNNQPTPATDAATPAPEAPAQDAPAAEAASAPSEQAPVLDWRRALDEAPTDELRRHPRFAGIVGSEKQSWEQDWAARKQAEADAKARVEAEEALREMARRNPVEFADRWLSSEEARQQQERLTALESNARQAVGRSVGAAFHAIPEWAQITRDPDALARLTTAMQGKDGDDVLAAWNATAVEIVAAKRAAALAEQQLTARLAAERTAWETEAAAQGFVRSDRPDLVRGGRAANADPEPPYDPANPKPWRAWYWRTTPGVR